MPEGLPGRDVCWAAACDFLDSGWRGQGPAGDTDPLGRCCIVGLYVNHNSQCGHYGNLVRAKGRPWRVSRYKELGEQRSLQEWAGRQDDQERTVWEDISQ